jgi:hypothetical protein
MQVSPYNPKNRRSHWYIDSECLKYMIGTLKKEKDVFVTFDNDNSTKIFRKGIVSLGNKDVVVGNVLHVENMKHNLLSVSQMSDQGYTLIFNSK